MMAAVVYDEPRTSGWLRDQRFDLIFIIGLTLLGLASGVAVLTDPRLLMPILLAVLWLLGYHHVISTYTRLCFDKDSLRRYGFLVFGLPFVVAAGCVLAVTVTSGIWIIASIYFYWQWFHYTRQSWGIAQAYRRKSERALLSPTKLDTVLFYALPVAGVVNRSSGDVDSFLGLPIRLVPVPPEIATVTAIVAGLLVAGWIVQTVLQYRRGQATLPYVLYQASHHVMFGTAYILIPDITVGWLVINIWHNAQYVLFVWLFNNRRFAAGESAKAPLLSKLSQDGRLVWYLGFCLLLSTTVYWTIGNVLPLLLVVPVFIVYQIINFHHYVVDAVIWRGAQVKHALQST
jgi:hypothetical protein